MIRLFKFVFKTAEKLGKDLSCLDFLILSHSHLDHTWGLGPFIRYLTKRTIEGLDVKYPKFVAFIFPESLSHEARQVDRE